MSRTGGFSTGLPPAVRRAFNSLLKRWRGFRTQEDGSNTIDGNLDVDGAVTLSGDLDVDGAITVADSGGQSNIFIDAIGANDARMVYRDDGVVRWDFRYDESADVFKIRRHNTSGVFQDTPLEVDGSTGDVTVQQAYTSFTPTLTAVTTDPTLGTGPTQTGGYVQFGTLVTGQAQIRFGSSGAAAGSGAYRVNLPVSADTTLQRTASVGGRASVVGEVMVRDESGGTVRLGYLQLVSATTALIMCDAGTSVGAVTDSSPWTWTNNDWLFYKFSYISV